MAELMADIPPIQAFIRSEFLFDLKPEPGGFIPCVVFGISSVQGRAIGFNAMDDRGAQIDRLPIHAFAMTQLSRPMPLDMLELWDCPSYQVAVHTFRHLAGSRCRMAGKDRKWYGGAYLFTIDWYGSVYAEAPGDIGHKSAHVIALENGNLAAQPNNRILWYDPATIADPYDHEERPEYLTNTHTWRCEAFSKWATEDSPRMFYGVTQTEANNGT